MERHYKIIYNKDVLKKDLLKIPVSNKLRIHRAINDKLTQKPELFGKPLRQSLKGYRSLRVGNYRVVFEIFKKTIKIHAIQKRAVVYTKVIVI